MLTATTAPLVSAAATSPIVPLTEPMLRGTKSAYSVRRIPRSAMKTLVTEQAQPRSGDLVLAEIVRLGQHRRIELANGRRAHLHPGDRVVLAYGNRYAPDQFEAYVPEDLGPCHMVAAGGIAARQHSRHRGIRDATGIRPLGLVAGEDGQPLNLADWGLAPRQFGRGPVTLAVLGTAMNAGKTTSAAGLIRGLRRAGLRVGAAKVTGTGAGGDVWLMQDSGAEPVLDFTDAGYPSTFGLALGSLQGIVATLSGHLVEAGAEVIVLEVADGLLQPETAALLSCDWFRRQVDGVVFAAGDALGAKAGVEVLLQHRFAVLAVSGSLTASPLAMAEARRVVPCPVLSIQELGGAAVLERLGLVAKPKVLAG